MLIILMVALFLFRAIYVIKNPDVKTARLAEDLRRMFGAPLPMMLSGSSPTSGPVTDSRP